MVLVVGCALKERDASRYIVTFSTLFHPYLKRRVREFCHAPASDPLRTLWPSKEVAVGDPLSPSPLKDHFLILGCHHPGEAVSPNPN